MTGHINSDLMNSRKSSTFLVSCYSHYKNGHFHHLLFHILFRSNFTSQTFQGTQIIYSFSSKQWGAGEWEPFSLDVSYDLKQHFFCFLPLSSFTYYFFRGLLRICFPSCIHFYKTSPHRFTNSMFLLLMSGRGCISDDSLIRRFVQLKPSSK